MDPQPPTHAPHPPSHTRPFPPRPACRVKELERYIAELEGALAEAVRERDEARQQLKAERAARAANAKRAERARAAAATAGIAPTAGGAATAGGAETRPEVTASQLEAPNEATDEPLQRALEEKRALQDALEAARQQLLEANARRGGGGSGSSSGGGGGGGGPARPKRLLPPQGRTPLQICSSNPPPVWRPWRKAGSEPARATPSKSKLEASVQDVRALLAEARESLGL